MLNGRTRFRCTYNSSDQEIAKESLVQMSAIPFGTTDWQRIERIEYKGERGLAYWRTQQFGNIRVRMVEYTPGYLADHWCVKGHILFASTASFTPSSKTAAGSHSSLE